MACRLPCVGPLQAHAPVPHQAAERTSCGNADACPGRISYSASSVVNGSCGSPPPSASSPSPAFACLLSQHAQQLGKGEEGHWATGGRGIRRFCPATFKGENDSHPRVALRRTGREVRKGGIMYDH